MSWKDHYKKTIDDKRDAQGDIVPPWAKHPDYECHTIGWRMGTGEDWLGYFRVFLDALPTDRATRLAYLKRHPPAPLSWVDTVDHVLNPNASARDDEDDDDERVDPRLAEYQALGLVKSDVAFFTWQQSRDPEATLHVFAGSPQDAARYATREFAFWSRLKDRTLPTLNEEWSECKRALLGDIGDLNLKEGLHSLAQFFCAGHVPSPWELDLSPTDFLNSFDSDMHYVDAFRLYVMSAFDDNEHLEREIKMQDAPMAWRSFNESQLML